MKMLVAIMAASVMLLSLGLRVYAAEDGRVTDEPADIQPYIEIQPAIPTM